MTDEASNVVRFERRVQKPEPEAEPPRRQITEFFLDPKTLALTLTLADGGDPIAVFRFAFQDVSPGNFDIDELLRHWTHLKNDYGHAS